MKKLSLYVCENTAPEFQEIITRENYEDVSLVVYPCLSLSKGNKDKLKGLLEASGTQTNDRMILCSKNCEILNLDSSLLKGYKIQTFNYCFRHLANEQLIEYIIENGGYIISSGWLKNWKANLSNAGFNQETAIGFYKEFCRELVCLDSDIDENLVQNMKDIAQYLELPYKIIKVDLENIKVLLRSLVLEWRLQKNNKAFDNEINELKRQNAEYAALIHIMEKIAIATNKRDIVSSIIETFTLIFGAKNCWYTELMSPIPPLFGDVEELMLDAKQLYIVSEDNNYFVIKVEYAGEILGLIKAEGFLFPKYIRKYVEFASSIAHICGVVMQNVKHIEMLETHKETLRHMSFHDGLTDLYNRAYFNEVLEKFKSLDKWALFMCDLDGLKEINDTYGHSEGDRAICLAAGLLRKCFRETDIIVRLGGDEFAVLVPECDRKMAQMLKERFYQTVECNKNEQNFWTLRVSMGYAVAESANMDMELLINSADEEMYREKKCRKKCFTTE